MAILNPELLTVARELRGRSQTALAQALGISQGHLSKIENGVQECDDPLFEKIARTLNFPESFFDQDARAIGRPISVHPMYRKKSDVPKKVLDRIVAEINIRLINIKKLLLSVDYEPSLKLPRYDIEDFNGTPSDIAVLVRRAWLLPNGPISNLTDVVESAGVLIVLCDFSYANIDGISVTVPGMPPCIFLNGVRPADRIRFSLAHELGHLIMHQQPGPLMEDEADKFASAFLLPEREFASSCGPRIDLTELARLKFVWRVSMQAALVRAKQTGVISDSQSGYLWRQMSSLGYRKKEPPTTEFAREEPSVMQDLLRVHLTDLGYSVDELSKALHLYEDDLFDFYGLREKQAKLKIVK